MRSQWIMAVFSSLVCLGLLLIILGQKQVLAMLENGSENLRVRMKKTDESLKNENLFKVAVEKQVAEGLKTLEDLQAAVAKFSSEMEKMKTDDDACQEEKRKKAEELAATEKERAETQASLKLESDAWTQEIDTLKAQLRGYRPICDYVKAGTVTLKLCNITTTLAPDNNQVINQ